MSISMRSTKTRGVDVEPIDALFNFDHVPGTHDLQKAWFSGLETVQGENKVRDTILQIVDEFGTISKGRLVDEVRERLGNDAPGINNVRNWVTEMTEVTNELEADKLGTSLVIKRNGAIK
jgi:hypothetical protein